MAKSTQYYDKFLHSFDIPLFGNCDKIWKRNVTVQESLLETDIPKFRGKTEQFHVMWFLLDKYILIMKANSGIELNFSNPKWEVPEIRKIISVLNDRQVSITDSAFQVLNSSFYEQAFKKNVSKKCKQLVIQKSKSVSPEVRRKSHLTDHDIEFLKSSSVFSNEHKQFGFYLPSEFVDLNLKTVYASIIHSEKNDFAKVNFYSIDKVVELSISLACYLALDFFSSYLSWHAKRECCPYSILLSVVSTSLYENRNCVFNSEEEVIRVFLTSERIMRTLTLEKRISLPYRALFIREVAPTIEAEFRCFIYLGKLRAISSSTDFGIEADEKEKVIEIEIQNFMHQVIDLLPYSDAVVDVAMHIKKKEGQKEEELKKRNSEERFYTVIEVNNFGADSPCGSGQFDWKEDYFELHSGHGKLRGPRLQ